MDTYAEPSATLFGRPAMALGRKHVTFGPSLVTYLTASQSTTTISATPTLARSQPTPTECSVEDNTPPMPRLGECARIPSPTFDTSDSLEDCPPTETKPPRAAPQLCVEEWKTETPDAKRRMAPSVATPCAMCGGSTSSTDEEVATDADVAVHRLCALWSPEVVQREDGEISNVSSACRRGQQLKCAICRKTGATLGCAEANCQRSYHYPCARRHEDVLLDTDTWALYCPIHRPRQPPHTPRKKRPKKRRRLHTRVPLYEEVSDH